ncbi:VWA domain-containing protein [Micromonospora sp. ANENR4]|uniref:vWA domain-containing protein n=1 Tax=Micromonospora TaxID=1873 RepID=UPI00188EEE2B|nr:VWA domain-containing protein [Micromonospora sp. ANENR4]MBF5033056.1 VWA domain-containing protein [Micromonospora sp. ANENR4]
MQRVLPLYLAVDVSGSMAHGARLDAVQQALILLFDELLSSPALGDQVRVGVMTFADKTELVLPLGDMTELRSMPRLSPRGATAFGPLFRALGRTIERDMRVLRSRDTLTYRPFIFLITDSTPSDHERDWGNAFDEFDRRTKARLVVITMTPDRDDVWRRLRPVAVYQWNETHDEVLADRIYGAVYNYARTLTTSTMLGGHRDGQPLLPPPYPHLGEPDIR